MSTQPELSNPFPAPTRLQGLAGVSQPGQQPPALVVLTVLGLVMSLLAVVSLWTPWTLVVQDTAASTVTVTANGFHTIPQSCLFTCAEGLASPPAYLLLVLAAATALALLLWLLNRETVLIRTACGLAAATTGSSVINIVYLYLATLTITANIQDTQALPFLGAVMGVLSSAAAGVTTVIMVVIDRRHRARRNPR
jgi:hypothetical protein